jgi:hypothetical protein
MNTPRRAIVLAFVFVLTTGYCVHAESSWSLTRIWPFQRQSAAKKKAAAIQTTGYPKSSARKSRTSRWLPTFTSVTSAPKRLWSGAKKILTPSRRTKTSGRSGSSSPTSRRQKTLSHRSGSRGLEGPRTVGEFISRKRPGFY